MKGLFLLLLVSSYHLDKKECSSFVLPSKKKNCNRRKVLLLNVLIDNKSSSSLSSSEQLIDSSTSASIAGSISASTSTPPESSSSCPFSRSFPRHRIDLTSVKKKEKNPYFSLPSLPPVPFIADLQKSWAKKSLDQAYSEEDVNILWFDDQNRLELFASLWRVVADFSSAAATATTTTVVAVAFHDDELKTVRQWIDILEWMQQQTITTIISSYIIIPQIIDDGDLPKHIIFKRESINMNNSAKSPLSSEKERQIIESSIVEKRTQKWVKRILVDQGICPFTKSVTKSGQGLSDLSVPVARIYYGTSFAETSQICLLMADTWDAISNMIQAGPSGKEGISSILFAAPAFDYDFDLWAGPIFAMLEAGVVAAGAEKEVGVVCFHPQYATPDGSSWPGFGHMHSVPRLQKWLDEIDPYHNLTKAEVAAGGAWQRRTPHATINVLRADQLEVAEGRRNTRNLYSENINKLVGKTDGIGSTTLERDLAKERSLR